MTAARIRSLNGRVTTSNIDWILDNFSWQISIRVSNDCFVGFIRRGCRLGLQIFQISLWGHLWARKRIIDNMRSFDAIGVVLCRILEDEVRKEISILEFSRKSTILA
jgi:hypothetical protein